MAASILKAKNKHEKIVFLTCLNYNTIFYREVVNSKNTNFKGCFWACINHSTTNHTLKETNKCKTKKKLFWFFCFCIFRSGTVSFVRRLSVVSPLSTFRLPTQLWQRSEREIRLSFYDYQKITFSFGNNYFCKHLSIKLGGKTLLFAKLLSKCFGCCQYKIKV